jgi:hypothetical protein
MKYILSNGNSSSTLSPEMEESYGNKLIELEERLQTKKLILSDAKTEEKRLSDQDAELKEQCKGLKFRLTSSKDIDEIIRAKQLEIENKTSALERTGIDSRQCQGRREAEQAMKAQNSADAQHALLEYVVGTEALETKHKDAIQKIKDEHEEKYEKEKKSVADMKAANRMKEDAADENLKKMKDTNKVASTAAVQAKTGKDEKTMNARSNTKKGKEKASIDAIAKAKAYQDETPAVVEAAGKKLAQDTKDLAALKNEVAELIKKNNIASEEMKAFDRTTAEEMEKKEEAEELKQKTTKHAYDALINTHTKAVKEQGCEWERKYTENNVLPKMSFPGVAALTESEATEFARYQENTSGATSTAEKKAIRSEYLSKIAANANDEYLSDKPGAYDRIEDQHLKRLVKRRDVEVYKKRRVFMEENIFQNVLKLEDFDVDILRETLTDFDIYMETLVFMDTISIRSFMEWITNAAVKDPKKLTDHASIGYAGTAPKFLKSIAFLIRVNFLKFNRQDAETGSQYKTLLKFLSEYFDTMLGEVDYTCLLEYDSCRVQTRKPKREIKKKSSNQKRPLEHTSAASQDIICQLMKKAKTLKGQELPHGQAMDESSGEEDSDNPGSEEDLSEEEEEDNPGSEEELSEEEEEDMQSDGKGGGGASSSHSARSDNSSSYPAKGSSSPEQSKYADDKSRGCSVR